MPRQDSKRTKTLIGSVRIAPRFRRSTHLEEDLGRADALAGYVVSPLALDTAARIAARLADPRRPNCAWNLVGPYGTGKSSFLVFLASLLGEPAASTAAQAVLPSDSSAEKQALERALKQLDGPLLPVTVTGEHTSIAHALVRAASRAASRYWSGRGVKPKILRALAKATKQLDRGSRLPDSDVVALVRDLAVQVKRSAKPGIGLCVLIDEMGKLVEWAATSRSSADIYLLQLLAEATERSDDATLCLITTLHQSLDAYAEGLPRRVRNEWAKIAGRFELVPYLESPHHLARLVSDAIEHKRGAEDHVAIVAARGAVDATCEVAGSSDDAPRRDLVSAAPLHPAVTVCLGPVFRSRLGQNERSLFAFLSSHEPHGFQAYLRTNRSSPYLLADLFDYVVANSGARVSADGDRTWAVADQAIARLPDDANEADAALIKTLTILSLVGLKVGLRADADTLALCSGREKREVVKALKRLERASVIVFRKFKAAYQVWDGSDLNIPELLTRARTKVRGQGGLAGRLQRLFSPLPVVATRHYYQTGTLRHLAARYTPVPPTAADWPRARHGDGDLLYVVPDRVGELNSARAMLKQKLALLPETSRPLVVVLPDHAESLLAAVVDYFAVDEALQSTPELASDTVARRELQEQKLAAQDRLTEALTLAFTPSSHTSTSVTWHTGGRTLPLTRPSRNASLIFDEAYHAAPVIKNELVNRDSLSSAAAAARRELLERLFTHGHKERLGIEGSPPELAIYRSVFGSSGLHQQVDGRWTFVPPRRKKHPYFATWKRIDGLLSTAGERTSVAAIMDSLACPPLGVRAGITPILVVAYYLTRRYRLFLYEDGSFVPTPSADLVQRLLKRPDTFELQRATTDTRLAKLVAATAEALRGDFEVGNSTLLEVTKAIVGSVADLSPYAASTQNLSEAARRTRSAIKSARDPVRLLSDALPKSLGVKPFKPNRRGSQTDYDEFAKQLAASLRELRALDMELAGAIDRTLRRLFGGPDEPVAFYQALRERAAALNDKELPLNARGVRVAITSVAPVAEESLPSLVRDLATSIIGKPPLHWSDGDSQHFEYRALEAARAFHGAEELRLARGSKARRGNGASRALLRVSVLDADGNERHGIATCNGQRKNLDAFHAAVHELAEQHGISTDDLAYSVIAAMLERIGGTPTNAEAS